jgi:5-methylcytosine-specific restriction endonuclease McrA
MDSEEKRRKSEYDKAYYSKNKTKRKQQRAAYYAANREKCLATVNAWQKMNKDKVAKYQAKYESASTHKRNALTSKRRASKLKATPTWLTQKDIGAIKTVYEQAAAHQQQVDHIIPLQGKEVCGLHVFWNLRAISASENSKKKNKLPEHAECLASTT